MSDQVASIDDPTPRRARTYFVRGETVRHVSTEMVGASRGVVLAVLTDLQNQAYAAVQWKGGSLTLTHLYLLERTAPAQNPKH